MNFASLSFLLFFPVAFAVYWGLRQRARQNAFLILASYFFYAWWDVRFCSLLLASSLVDYWIGRSLGICRANRWRRWLLAASVGLNIGLLGLFKYFDFFSEGLVELAGVFGWQFDQVTLQLVLPVGISFYTFQTLSYTIDCYRRRIEPTSSLLDYLGFVSFFPQLVAGPIERASRLLPQFANHRSFDPDQASSGCRLILWGLVKKLAIADRLAVFVDPIYAAPDSHSGPLLALATVAFAFQIYCDFSAYSDIAIGSARLLGFDLMRNFAYPYFSESLSEFWKRWHISLSTWFRDYVYIPLGGSRVSAWRQRFNLLATFLVSGIWHGAAWNFIYWGTVHGVLSQFRRSDRNKSVTLRQHPTREPDLWRVPMGRLINMALTFLIVCYGWIFFRAESVGGAFQIQYKILVELTSVSAYQAMWTLIESDKFLRTTLVVLLGFVIVEWIQRHRVCPLEITTAPVGVRWAVYSCSLWGMFYLVRPFETEEFIYFAF